jgi:hypothetical protein
VRIPSGPEAPKSSYTGRIYGRNPDLLVANIDEIILQTGMGPYMGDPYNPVGNRDRGRAGDSVGLGSYTYSHYQAYIDNTCESHI